MKQFLLESWELWYWALFSPSKLRRRLNDWLPAPPKADRADGAAESDSGSDDDASNPIAAAFMFRKTSTGKARRFVAQFAFVTLLSSVPLAAYCLAFRGPAYLLIVAAVWLAAIGIGLLVPSLGLLSPFLLTFVYLASPSTIDVGLADALRGPVRRIVLGLCAGIVVAVPVSLAVERLWRFNWVLVGWLTLLPGTALGLGTSLWLAMSHDVVAAILVTGITSFFMLLSLGEGRYRRKDISYFAGTLAATIGVVIAFGLLPGGKSASRNAVAGMATFLPSGLIAITAGAFLMRAVVHAGGKRAPAAVAGAVVGGICGGSLLVILMGFLITLANMPAFPFGLFAWSIGFAVAPARSKGYSPSEWLRALHELRDQKKIMFFFLLSHPSVWAVLLVVAWLCALRFPSGWTVLAAAVAAVLGYFRILPDFPVLALVSAWRASRVTRTSPAAVVGWLRTLPPYAGELVPLPLPGHAKIFGATATVDPAATFEIIQDIFVENRSLGIDRTLDVAFPLVAEAVKGLDAASRSRLLTARLCALTNVHAIARVAQPGDVALFFLATDCYADRSDEDSEVIYETPALDAESDIRRFFPKFQSLARGVKAAIAEEQPFRRERALERCAADTETLKAEIAAADLGPEIASRWLRALERWQSVLSTAVSTYTASLSGIDLVQPFQSGNPIRPDRRHLFKGRAQFAADMARELADRSRPTVVLHGPRRCGKSSFLLNLSWLFPGELIPVYIDMQSQALTGGEADFCYGIVRAAVRDLRGRGDDAKTVSRDEFRMRPYAALEDWLDEIRPLLGARRLLICMDEFEKLPAAIARGAMTMSVLDELRHLIQHREELSFIFCGAQTLEEMGPRWSSYFINARPIEMHYLEPQDARDLLEEPDPAFGLRYEPGVVEQVLAETSCQPYLLQLLGEEMVKAAIRHHVRKIDPALLEEAIRGALTAGEIYFTNMWDETTGATPAEVASGRALLRTLAGGGAVQRLDGDETTRAALARLERYRVVDTSDGARIYVPLAARWIRERAR